MTKSKRARELDEVREMINGSGDVVAKHDKRGTLVSVETEQTLHDALLERGYTHRPSAAFNARDIVDASGAVVYTGSASETWRWLKRLDRAKLAKQVGTKITARTKLVHGTTRVRYALTASCGTVVDSTKHEVRVAWDGSKLPPRWHSKRGMEMMS